MLRIYLKTSSLELAARTSAVGNALNNAGVTIFTRLSVHWADKLTATKSSKGLE